jgi:hypothetical protein
MIAADARLCAAPSQFQKGQVNVSARNGDGIKLCESGTTKFYFPFDDERHSFEGMTEARFYRYVNGYRREILPEVEKLRDEEVLRLAEKPQADAATWIENKIENLDQFIVWLRQRLPV